MKIYTIYKITNKINDKIYIGYTSLTIEDRFDGHIKESNNSSATHFHNALRKYGSSNFIIEAMYQSSDKQHTLKIMEPYFIAEYNTFEGVGYNLTSGGEGFTGTHSDRSKQLMSDKAKGRKPWNKGKKYARGNKNNFKHTEETKQLISKNTIDTHKGQVAWNTGLTKDTDERVAQMYENRKSNNTWQENFKKTPEHEANRLKAISRSVTIDGNIYVSARPAFRSLKSIKYPTLIKRIESKNFPEYRWSTT